MMAKVKIVLIGGEFWAEKWFELSAVPPEGREICLKLFKDGGHGAVRVHWVKQYAG